MENKWISDRYRFLEKSKINGFGLKLSIYFDLLYVKYIEKMGLPIFLIDFLCILSNYIDNFSPNPFIFDFSRNPDRSEIHLFSIFQDFPISPVKAVKKLLKTIRLYSWDLSRATSSRAFRIQVL